MKQFKDFLEEGYEDHHLFPDYMQKILKKHEASPEEKARNAKRAAEARANAKPVNHKAEPYKPLGGRDENSGRSYSEETEQIDELSNDTLASYKKKAGESASEADKKGDFAKGNKRFKGIMTATFKQFANDSKK